MHQLDYGMDPHNIHWISLIIKYIFIKHEWKIVKTSKIIKVWQNELAAKFSTKEPVPELYS